MKHFAPPAKALWKNGIAVFTGSMLVLAAITTIMTWTVRAGIHREIEDRDARAIHALARLELANMAGYFNPAWKGSELSEYIQWEALLATADYPGILGIQLLSTSGENVSAVPDSFLGPPPDPQIIARAQTEPAARYLGRQPLAEYLHNGEAALEMPLLEIVIPLEDGEDGELLGLARYLIDGEGIRGALAAVDRQLMRQAAGAFAGGGMLVSALLLFSFFRLHRSSQLVEQRSQALIRANADLALAVKTNAVGGIASHLIHDLKNPLAGMRSLVERIADQSEHRLKPEDVDAARGALQRMEALIQEITQLLREEAQSISFSLELSELRDALLHKIQPLARERGVNFLADDAPTGSIDSARANLLLLILYNLSQNAIEVTPTSLAVTLHFKRNGDRLEFLLTDRGPGIPAELMDSLFDAGRSRKTNGSGLGLAISRQLAYHIDADLKLLKTGPDGSTFHIAINLDSTPVGITDPDRPSASLSV